MIIKLTFMALILIACKSNITRPRIQKIERINKRVVINTKILELRAAYQKRCEDDYQLKKMDHIKQSRIQKNEKLLRQVFEQSKLYCRCMAKSIEDSNYFRNKIYLARQSDNYIEIITKAHDDRSKFPEIVVESEKCENEILRK